MPFGWGIATGLILGILARMFVRPLFVRLLPTFDPGVMTLVPLLLLIAGAVTSYIPARKVARIDPYVALRQL